MTAKGRVFANPTWKVASPVVSVLIPFLRDDPSALLKLLDEEAGAVDGSVEIVVLDDGTRDPELTKRLTALIKYMTLPARLITLPRNEGRSIGRNRLATAARGGSLLFLDSDMRPDYRRFLRDWADLVAREDPPVAFGGFSLLQAPDEPRFAVHRSMATKSECVPYTVRARQPEKYVYTSNLLVRRDVFAAEAFDPGFTGWGWEDVEWAMRVSKRFRVLHVDNPATHMGLDTVADLAGKYEQSAPNFARVVDRHPAIVSAYPSYRAARLLKRLPGLNQLRPLLRRAAETEGLPVATRAFSLRLYRAALYAGAIA
ncbi:glycosyltransferase [uncultured Brevundimonas sp.]|uniref:glycosyltransferase family 2 protein n=1 Tax=uncultured Brevundimonas sp. TaxID=213418 RepID=UPI0030EF1D93|tara:strand:- start:27302 stop:28243 length:942 start_codon:yes stop_codon:yes gene_type:complete